VFPAKPEDGIRRALLASGWGWSPFVRAWRPRARGGVPPPGVPWRAGAPCDFVDEDLDDELDDAAAVVDPGPARGAGPEAGPVVVREVLSRARAVAVREAQALAEELGEEDGDGGVVDRIER
jgi:hypothetical protein